MSECLIEIEHLSKSFGKETPLSDINAKVYSGDVIAILGPSGTGKSTLLRCLNGLETPSGGTIKILGNKLSDDPAVLGSLRQQVGMVFQSFNLFNHLTCLENIMQAPMDLKKMSKKEAEGKAHELLSKVGMSDHADAFCSELSGGQKQRVAIARAMAMDPVILLMDEPTSALDPDMVAEVEDVIRRLAASGITMLIVTHEMEFAKSVCNRAFYLSGGTILEDGKVSDIIDKYFHHQISTS